MKRLGFGAFIRVVGLSAIIITGLILSSTNNASPHGQDMQNMPGMSKSKPAAQKKRTSKRKPAKKHNMANMPGMTMPGMNMSRMHKQTRRKKRTTRRKQSTTKHQMGNMPGMKMPAMKMPATQTSPAPKPSPQRMNMPGMPQTSPSPSASPQKVEMNMPGMQMPSASPNSQASPQPKMEMNMPMPGASPSPGAMSGMKGMEGMGGMGPMSMGPLMVMSGNDMGIRVGSSDTNIMSMGAMGSGTSWQPSSGPMLMHYKIAGDWLLMFHYNIFVDANHQG